VPDQKDITGGWLPVLPYNQLWCAILAGKQKIAIHFIGRLESFFVEISSA